MISREQRQKNLLQWMGESKVVRNGKPLVVYHGTGADIHVFDNSQASLPDKNKKGAIWFSTAPEVAGLFAGHQRGEKFAGVQLGHSNILPVYLKVENPWVDRFGELARYGGISQEYIRELQADGFDGIHWPEADADLPDTTMDGPVRGYYRNRFGVAWGESEEGYPDQWAVFEPSQIKSAVGNSGLFLDRSVSLIDPLDSPEAKMYFLLGNHFPIAIEQNGVSLPRSESHDYGKLAW